MAATPSKAVLITGCSTGIGRACAELLHAQGARVVTHHAATELRITEHVLIDGLVGLAHGKGRKEALKLALTMGTAKVRVGKGCQVVSDLPLAFLAFVFVYWHID